MAYDLDRIQINIQADTSQAVKAYQQLSRTLTRLKKVTQGDFGLGKLAVETNRFARAIRSSLPVIERYARALETISQSRLRRVSADAAARAERQAAKETARSVDDSQMVDSKKVKDANKELEQTGKTLDRVDKRAKRASKSFKLFNGQIGKILMYRAIRGAISAVANAMKEGSDNYYTFLSTSNNPQARQTQKTLDDISSTLLALKNTMGVTMLQLAVTFKPVIESLSNGIMTLAEGITALSEKAKGNTKYFAANRDAIKKWSDAVKNATQGFDELNVLAGTGDTMPQDMFVEKDVDQAIEAFEDEAKKILGVVAAYEGLKAIVGLITNAFSGKNKKLKEQTDATGKDTSAVQGLNGALGKTAGVLGGAAGVIALVGATATALGKLSFKKTTSDLGELDTSVSNTSINWKKQLKEMQKATEEFVTEINTALGKIGVGVGGVSKNTSGIPLSNEAYLESLGVPKIGLPKVGVESVSSVGSGTNISQKSIMDEISEFNKKYIKPVTSGASLLVGGALAGGAMGMSAGGGGAAATGGGATVTNIISGVTEKAAGLSIVIGLKEILEQMKKSLGINKDYPMMASGGFVNAGQVFVAREAGPEMVGTIGGKTAVANNDQITEAISSAVYEAMIAAGGGSVNVTLEGDANKLFRVVQNEARKYNRSTGSYAF